MKIALSLYRHLVVPTALRLLHIGSPLLSAKIQMMMDERQKANYLPLGTEGTHRPFWIHCSSGEFEYAKPVIRELKSVYPLHPIIVTYMSPSVKKSIQNFSQVDLSLPVPWDRPKEIQAFLDSYRPACLLIARTDAWPELMTQVEARKIPSLLFSATLAKTSSRLKWPSRIFSRLAFGKLSHIHCVSPQDKALFCQFVAPEKIEVVGDTRFDQVLYRKNHSKELKTHLKPQDHSSPVIVLGSTWPEDEKVWIQALPDLRNQFPGLRIMIAPHEPTTNHLEALTSELNRISLPLRFYSNARQWSEGEVLIIDEVGLLSDLYSWGNLAFVGGSFKKQVHSVMEPLSHGLPTLVGPRHENNREALQFAKFNLGAKTQMVTPFSTSKELSEKISQLQPHWERQRSKEIIQAEVQKHQGASLRVLTWIGERVLH